MSAKLAQGDRFPSLTLNIVGGQTLTVPDDIDGRYLALLFYRGEW